MLQNPHHFTLDLDAWISESMLNLLNFLAPVARDLILVQEGTCATLDV